MSLSSPQPSVLHLLTIFRQITAGEIRIPAFQREFVWREKQVLDLLESVRAGYPVGSILLWYAERPLLKISDVASASFPVVAERYPTSYVLDGMQRLSSLYGVFHFGTATSDSRFNIWYDLHMEVFVHEEDLQVEQAETAVPLAALFVPRALLGHQGRLAKLESAEALIDRLVALQGAFQEYMLPVVQIRGEDIGPIVSIFEKINSTGTALSRVDFMRAITWAQDFDLSKAIDEAKEWLELFGYSLSDETIVKCVGMILGLDPTVDALLKLRSSSPEELRSAFTQFPSCFIRVINFLGERMNIRSASYVPYEGQLLVAFRAVGMGDAADNDDFDALSRWLWASSFNESLRGKPDHYVTRAITNWRSLVAGGIRGLEPRLRITEADFVERRLIKGKALSTAFSLMFAVRQSKDLFAHGPIEQYFFVLDGDTAPFIPVLTAEQLARAGAQSSGSAKLFANVVLAPSVRLMNDTNVSAQVLRLGDHAPGVLESQFIDRMAWQLLKAGDFAGFLEARARMMLAMAKELVGEANAPSDAHLAHTFPVQS